MMDSKKANAITTIIKDSTLQVSLPSSSSSQHESLPSIIYYSIGNQISEVRISCHSKNLIPHDKI